MMDDIAAPSTERSRAKGLRQFLDREQQRGWLEGEYVPTDADERSESLEQRFKYLARFEKLLKRSQAEDVLDIVGLYGTTCIPIPRTTERDYWSVSCLPSTNDKPLVRVNASWMELFTLLPDPSVSLGAGGEGIRARFILHLVDFTQGGLPEPDHLDADLLERCAGRAEDVTYAFWQRPEILVVKIRGSASIRRFIAHSHSLRAIRNFNLTHMNRGRNAYQGSHCYSVADHMLAGTGRAPLE